MSRKSKPSPEEQVYRAAFGAKVALLVQETIAKLDAAAFGSDEYDAAHPDRNDPREVAYRFLSRCADEARKEPTMTLADALHSLPREMVLVNAFNGDRMTAPEHLARLRHPAGLDQVAIGREHKIVTIYYPGVGVAYSEVKGS